MPLQKARPMPQRAETEPLPGLTHQPSLESVGSPITPSHDANVHPVDQTLRFDTNTPDHKDHHLNAYPFPNPKSTTQSSRPAEAPLPTIQISRTPTLPSKDLPFLAQDPFAKPDDDIIPFDKNKPIVPSRHGSVRSIMSTSSMQSLKRGLSSIKRTLTRSGRSRRVKREGRRQTESGLAPPAQTFAEDGITPINRAQTYMMGPSMHAPRRVETYQVSAMAF